MYFKPSTHEYIINDKKYKSFSSIIKLVEPSKDWEEIAIKYAKKNKMTVEQVKELWSEKGRVAREKGTMFHALKEDEDINQKDKPVFYSTIEDDIKPIRSLETLEDGIHPELTLYNNEYQACGTADKVIIETIDGVRYVDILDYKTSETIDIESYYDTRNQKHAMLANPLQSVMDCNFMKYSLQLSMYAFFLEKYNFVPRNLVLIHLVIKELQEDKETKYKIDFEGKKFHVEHEVEYPVKYMKKEVKALLQFHKSKLK